MYLKKYFVMIMAVFLSLYLNALNENTLVIKSLVSIQPDTKESIPDLTTCAVSYDKENIYLDWTARLSQELSQEQKGRNDELQDSDFLRAQITTLPGDAYCYVFYVYPDGSCVDAIRDGNFNLKTDWDSHFTVKNTISQNSWHCKMTIPFKDLRFNGDPPYQWNVSFARMYFQTNRIYSDPFLSISQMGKDYFKKGHPLTINENLPVNMNISLIPYFNPGCDLNKLNGNISMDRVGCDFSFKPNTLINFKLSQNPDFSDAPVNRAQNNFNQKYDAYEEENRYFFTEDLDAFNMDTDIFYTRRIIQPELALKMTGTNDLLTYGALYCRDKSMNDSDYKNKNFAIMTIKPKWDQFELGMSSIIMTNNVFDNYVFQLNPSYNFSPNTNLTWKNNITLYRDSLGMKEGIDTFVNFFSRNGNINGSVKLGFYSKDFIVKMGRVDDPSNIYCETNIDYSDNSYKSLEDFEINIWLNPTIRTKHYDASSISYGSYVKIDPQGPWYSDFNLSVNYLKEMGTQYELPQTKNYLGYNMRDRNISIGFLYSTGYEYNYDLSEKLYYAYIEPNIDAKIHRLLQLYYGITLFQYPFMKEYKKEIVDNSFVISNLEVKSLLTDQISISSGFQFVDFLSGSVGVYSNLQYEYSKIISIYAGLSHRSHEESQKWKNDYLTGYCKFRWNLNY